MEIVLGVSMTPTTVRMVLVEGEKADGLTVDHDVFDITAIEGSATPSAQEQVIAAIVGTQESAVAAGHKLIATGVTWSDHTGAAALREALAARRIDDVLLFSELHAAGSLAQAVGRAVGYDKTALMFIERDTATLSVVEAGDGSIVKVLSRGLHSDDAMAVLSEMVATLEEQKSLPDAMFVVGSGVDVSSVKAHLENLMSIPVSAPDDAELALARGAALAAANAPRFEASTIGLAYSQDPDGPTAGSAYVVDPAAATQLAALSADEVGEPEATPAEEGRKPFLLVGSSLTAIFVVGVVALVISLAVSIRPTVDQRPNPGESAVLPSAAAPAPPVVQNATPAQAAPPAAPPPAAPPPPETIPAPIPVVQEQPVQAPRTVYAQSPAPKAPAPAPKAPAPAPAAVPAPAPAPAAPPPAPEPAAPPPADPVPAAPAPVYTPPPAYVPPPLIPAPLLPRPIYRQPPPEPWYPPQQQWPSPQYPPSYPPSYPSGPGGYGPGYGPGSGGYGGPGSYGPGSGGYSPGPNYGGSRSPWWP